MSVPNTPTVPPTSTQAGSQSIECPECAANVRIANQPLAGEVIRCGDCQAELEITSINPLRVELAPEVEEDWGE